LNIINPCECDGGWLKGQLHLHSTNSDGSEHPHAVIVDYERRGYDFIAITDHRTVPSARDMAAGTGIVVIPGEEYRGRGSDSELGVVGVASVLPSGLEGRAFVQAAMDSGAFVAYNHPTWHIHHWPIFKMMKFGLAHALEVYNAVCDWLPGASVCADKWDRLLTSGLRIFGTATDDAHTPEQRDRAWVMVPAGRDPAAIVAALKAGRFYASSGVEVRAVRLEDGVLTVEAPNAQEIRFFADRGSMRHRACATRASYEVREDDIYVRIELYGEGATRAWTQPVFVESDRSRELSDEFRNWYLGQQALIARW